MEQNMNIHMKLFQFIFLFSIFKVFVAKVNPKTFDDFKALLMYFNEPLLSQVSIKEKFFIDKGREVSESGHVYFEGGSSITMVNILTKTIDSGSGKFTRETEKFKDYLLAGVCALKTLDSSIDITDFLRKKKVDEIQRNQLRIVSLLNTTGKLVIPAGWVGKAPHSIGLIIEKAGDDHVNLIVVNTGDGTRFHYNSSDPKGNYPLITRLWIEFKGIPINEIFSEDCWFFRALAALRETEFIYKIEEASGSGPQYFYGSILVNFRKYLVEPDVTSTAKMAPAQRSGSCSLSSLLACLLYLSESELSYSRDRVLIGHEMLKSFLSRYVNDPGFLKLITNGFEPISRKLFRLTSSALAQQAFLYLEQKFPETFMNAGLLGKGRLTWTREKLIEALEILSGDGDKETFNILIGTVSIAIDIERILESNPIDQNSTELQLQEKASGYNVISDANINKGTFKKFKFDFVPEKGTINFLKLKPDRPNHKIEGFKDLASALSKVIGSRSIKVLDVFKGCHNPNWWEYLDEPGLGGEDIMEFWSFTSEILLNYLYEDSKPNDFDDFLMLAHLQISDWKCALRYDELIRDESQKLGLSKFKPPSVLELVLPFDTAIETTLENKNWAEMLTSFAADDLDEFYRLLMAYKQMSPTALTNETFPEATHFINLKFLFVENFSFIYSTIFGHSISEYPNTKKMFEQMLNHPNVKDKIENYKMTKGSGSVEMMEDHVDFKILIKEQGLFKDLFPHFFQLFNNMISIFFKVSAGCPFEKNNLKKSSIFESFEDKSTKFKCKKNYHQKYKFYSLENGMIKTNDSSIIPSAFQLCSNHSKIQNGFYAFRHSMVSFVPLIKFDSWFNNVRAAMDATIFNDPYFLYLSDRILNIPIFVKNCETGLIFKGNYYKYFPFMTGDKICYIIVELMRLIKMDINTVIKAHIETEIDNVLRRVLNLTIILVRFIGRLEHDGIISDELSSNQLSDIYNSLSRIKLSDDEMNSAVNIILTQICDLKSKNPFSFIKKLNINKVVVNIGTLRRVHWFLAKMSYSANNLGKSHVDDLFNRGFIYYPLEDEEKPATEELLKVLFLSRYNADIVDWEFKYDLDDMIIIKQKTMDGLESGSESFVIQLLSGTVIRNGRLLLEKSKIFNSELFKSYFEDYKAQARNGYLSMIQSTLIYTVTDYKIKGNTILILNQQSNFWLFRNYNDKWYKLVSSESEIDVMKLELDFYWIKDYKIYSRKSRDGDGDGDVIIIKDDESVPFIHMKIKNSRKFIELPMFSELKGQELSPAHSSIVLDKHLRLFTGTTKISVYVKDQGQYFEFIYIFQGLKFSDDPNRSIVIYETITGEFKILNRPGWIVENNQVINMVNGSGMIGTLVVRNLEDNQRFILIPLTEEGNIMNFNTFITIEEIPMTSDGRLPSPQTLQQKLLLAYKSIKAYEYDLARELLHPFYSITHNEPFSVKEVDIIKWIMNINGGGPETAALLLMTYLNYSRNKSKFPLHYEYNFDRGTLDRIDGVIIRVLSDYLSSLRDLPEKYYIYRYFPEFFDKISIESPFTSEYIFQTNFSREYSRYYEMSRIPPDNVSFGKVPSKIFDCIWRYFKTGDYYDNLKEQFEKYLKLMSKLVMRQSGPEIKNMSIEMLIYCAANNPELFKGINSKSELGDVARRCQDIFVDDFMPISLSHLSSVTPKDVLIESLRGDLDIGQEYFPNNKVNVLNVVNQDDLDKFKAIFDSLEKVKNGNVVINGIELEEGNSKVLTKLNNSMASYVRELQMQMQTSNMLTTPDHLLSEFLEYVNKRIESLEENLQRMATDLVMKTENNDLSKISEIQVLERLNRFLHLRKRKTFDNLYSCYQRQSINCIHNKFTQLSMEECSQLLDKSTEFYSNQVFLSHLTMIRTATEELRDNRLLDLKSFLDELRKIKDFNSRLMTPTILNFEFRSRKYRLKSEQVRDINNFTSIDNETGNYKSLVIQRMMSAGKTLVLGTISVIMKALDGTILSILVPPTSLYQSNTTAMQARTYSYFKSKGSNFVFPRFKFTGKDIKQTLNPFLDYLINQIEDTMRLRDYLILSPETLQSFLNSYVEALYKLALKDCPKETGEDDNLEDEQLVLAIEKFSKIYTIFRTRSSIILDEIDMTMDPKRELNFPTNKFEYFNMNAVILLTDLIEFSVFDEEVKSTGLNILNNNQSSLTSENYEKYRNLLFKYVRNQLDQPESIWKGVIFGNGSYGLLTNQRIIKFLEEKDISFMKDWIEALMELDKEIADALIIVKVQIWRGLKDVMRGEANLNYGSSGSNRPNIEYAVPYVAANTPSPSSEFADRWETMNKTLLMFASTACTEIIAKNMIAYIKRGVSEEISIDIGKTETTMYKNASALLSGINPLALNESKSEDVTLIHSALKSRSPAAIRLLFSYAIKEIFSKMKFPVEQITSNALNMTSMFGSVQGYSGTIDNVNILPQNVILDAYADHMENEKYNGGIAHKLINDSNNSEVVQLDEIDLKGSIDEILKKMIEIGDESKISALIDVGAFLKNFKNRQVAESILTLLKDRIKVVLYYEEVSNQVEFVRRLGDDKFVVGYISSTDPETIFKVTRAEIEERFTFYDQRHITGADILQPKNAQALLTVGTRVLLRDILQGTLRMRQFMTSQKVHLITTVATCEYYSSKVATVNNKLRVTDILRLGAINEDDKQAEENKKLAFVKIDNEIRRFVLDEISNNNNTKNKKDSIKIWFDSVLSKLFIRKVKEEPINLMVKYEEKETSQILNEYVEKWKFALIKISEKLENGFNYENYEKLLMTLDKLTNPTSTNVESLCYFLDRKLEKSINNLTIGDEVESVLLTEQVSETNLELLVQSVPERSERPYSLFFKLSSQEFGEDARILWMPKKVLVTSLYTIFKNVTDDIYKRMTENVMLTNGFRVGVSIDLIKYNINERETNYNLIFSRETLEGTHLLIQEFNDGRGIRALLLSHNSANSVVEQIKYKAPDVIDSKIWICDLSGFVIATNDDKIIKEDSNIIKEKESSRLMIFDLLIFNGSLDHILKSKYLKDIYMNLWLKEDCPHIRIRARFLLLRMTVLMEKIKYSFAVDNEEISKLRKIEAGVSYYNERERITNAEYKKPPIQVQFNNNTIQLIMKKYLKMFLNNK